MKNATCPPGFRTWSVNPKAEPGALAFGFGKPMLDLDTKWFNGSKWRVESFLKRGNDKLLWVDPAANVDKGQGTVSACIGYDDPEKNLKYRGTTDADMKHTSEVAYTAPLADGSMRMKLSMATKISKDNMMPDFGNAAFTLFWKAMLPKVSFEAALSPKKTCSLWAIGEASDNLSFGGATEYDMGSGKINYWEAGLLSTMATGSGTLATRIVTRDADKFAVSFLPPAQQVADHKVQVMAKVNHGLSDKTTDLSTVAEIGLCKGLDLKIKTTWQKLQNMSGQLALVWAAPGGWRMATSITSDKKVGVRMAQGSTPPPI